MKIFLLLFTVTFLFFAPQGNTEPSTNESQNNTHNTTANVPPATQQNAVTQPPHANNTESETENQKRDAEKKTRQEKEDALRLREIEQDGKIADATKWMMLIAGGSLFVSVVFAIFAYLQWREIRKQATATTDQLTEIRAQGRSSEHQLAQMGNQTTAMLEQSGTMWKALEATRDIVNQNERMIQTANKHATSAEKAIKVTKDIFYMSQRAYIGVGICYPEPLPIQPDQPFRVWCSIINSGNTPAEDLDYVCGIGIIDPANPIERPDFPETVFLKKGELLPKATTELRGEWISFKGNEYERLHRTENRWKMILFGKLTYKCVGGGDDREPYEFERVYDIETGTFINIGGTVVGQKLFEIIPPAADNPKNESDQ